MKRERGGERSRDYVNQVTGYGGQGDRGDRGTGDGRQQTADGGRRTGELNGVMIERRVVSLGLSTDWNVLYPTLNYSNPTRTYSNLHSTTHLTVSGCVSVSCQLLSVVNCQLSVVSCQLSVVSVQERKDRRRAGGVGLALWVV